MGELLALIIRNAKYVPKVIPFLPKILGGKNIAKEFEKKHGEIRPVIATRRWTGLVLAGISLIVLATTGVSLDGDMLTEMAGKLDSTIAGLTALWGMALTIWGIIKANR